MIKNLFLAVVFGPLLLFGVPVQAETEHSDDYQKGLTFYNQGDYSKALQYFDSAIDKNPNSWVVFEKEGYCYFHLGEEGQMNEAFDESLKLHPKNHELKAFIAGLAREDKAKPEFSEPPRQIQQFLPL